MGNLATAIEHRIVTIAPHDLVIDLPVSEQTVQEKMVSMKTVGLIQPITIWTKGKRIVDGFHRVEAARRLNWDTISCVEADYTEEGFWDARINSARQHHDVERPRLREWIFECWKSTPWHKLLSEEFSNQERATLAASLWRIVIWSLYQEHRDGRVTLLMPARYKIHAKLIRRNLGDDGLELVDWLDTKAQTWKVPCSELIQIIFGTFSLADEDELTHDTLNDIGQQQNWSVQERIKAARQLGGPMPKIIRPGFIAHDECLSSFLENGLHGETISAFVARQNSEVETEWQSQRKHEKDERERRRQEYQLELRTPRKVQQALLRSISALMTYIDEHEQVIATLPEGYEIFMGLAGQCVQLCGKLWPDMSATPVESNPLAAENLRLRQQLAHEHNARITAEAELLNRQERMAKLAEKLPDVMAWSEVQLPND